MPNHRGLSVERGNIFAAWKLHEDSIDYIVNVWQPKARRILSPSVVFIDPNEYHVTSVYSKSAFPFCPSGKRNVEAYFTGWRLLGPLHDQRTLVATIQSNYLLQLFAERYCQGADWSFKKYIPHISLVKNVPRVSVNYLPPLERKIILKEEYATDLDEDFSYAVKASLFVASNLVNEAC